MNREVYYKNSSYTQAMQIRQGEAVVGIYQPKHIDLLSSSDLVGLRPISDLQGMSLITSSAPFTQRPDVRILFDQDNLGIIKRIAPFRYYAAGPKENPGFIRRLRHTVFAITEDYRQSVCHQATMHAASVVLPDKEAAILILGDKGSGKTNVAYSLCRDFGAALVGNDLSIVGLENEISPYVHGGNASFTFRKASLLKHYPDDGIYFAADVAIRQGYEEKLTATCQNLGISAWRDKCPIKLIARVSVHSDTTEVSVSSSFNRLTESLRLHENMARYVRGQTTPVCVSENGTISGEFKSIDNMINQEFRNSLLNRFHQSEFIYASANSPQKVADVLIQALE
jgi:hypothetical protein